MTIAQTDPIKQQVAIHWDRRAAHFRGTLKEPVSPGRPGRVGAAQGEQPSHAGFPFYQEPQILALP